MCPTEGLLCAASHEPPWTRPRCVLCAEIASLAVVLQARAPVGTIFYMAPEVLLLASYKGSALEAAVSKRVGEKMDVWSLGVCLFELAAGKLVSAVLP